MSFGNVFSRSLAGSSLARIATYFLCTFSAGFAHTQSRPNIILIMADDLGWGDVGFNGNPVIKTPHLDAMAANGVQFMRAYSGAPVCSPTRASCLTGRNAERHGIYFANVGHLPPEEITVAEIVKKEGYATGFFGKWHLGTLTRDIRDGHRGGKEKESQHYAPPWSNGFDQVFATEIAVPTWDPMKNQLVPSAYWVASGKDTRENLEGDDSRIIMDRALPFIEKAAEENTPFFSVIWFHTPHSPVVAGPGYQALYPGFDDNRKHYFGCITAMDEQIGRLRTFLRKLQIEENTLILFTSDNGPAGEGGGIDQHPGKRQQGLPGPFRGRKGSLYEGGIRVPGLMEWPARFAYPKKTSLPISTADYLPTILSVLGKDPAKHPHPLDGVGLLDLIVTEQQGRPKPIAFKSYKQRAYTDNQYKLYSSDDGASYELYDLLNDPSESRDIAAEHSEKVLEMARAYDLWLASCLSSAGGADYK